MDADRDIIEQADRLMRRHRVFIAGAGRTPAAGEEVDDLPVLTEVVAAASDGTEATVDVDLTEPVVAPERIDALARALLRERLSTQRQAVADQLTAWLDAELPQVVMRVFDGVTDLVVARVTEEARSALLPRLHTALEDAESQPSPHAD